MTTAPVAQRGEVEVGLLRPGEEPGVRECMGASFGGAPSAEQWQHLYRDSPAGEAIVVVARQADLIVSHVALLLRPVRAFGREGLAAQSLDAMTRPPWRGRGLRTRLAREARGLAMRRGVLVTYGTANEQSIHGVVDQDGRRSLGPLPLLVRPVRPVRAAWRALVGRTGRAADGEPSPSDCAAAGPLPAAAGWAGAGAAAPAGWAVPDWGPEHTELFRAAPVPPVALVRDAAQLAWRYRETPRVRYLERSIGRHGDLAATLLVRGATLHGLRVLLVMEWAWRPGHEAAGATLVRDATRLARAAGADGVLALAMAGTAHRRALRRLGFLGVPGPFLPRRVRFCVRPETPATDPAAWLVPASWHLTWGDGFLL